MEQFYEKIYELCMNIQIFKYYGSFQIILKNILCKQNKDIVLIREK